MEGVIVISTVKSSLAIVQNFVEMENAVERILHKEMGVVERMDVVLNIVAFLVSIICSLSFFYQQLICWSFLDKKQMLKCLPSKFKLRLIALNAGATYNNPEPRATEAIHPLTEANLERLNSSRDPRKHMLFGKSLKKIHNILFWK